MSYQSQPPSERRQVLCEWNQTAMTHEGLYVHKLVEEQARRTPGQIAAIYEHEQLTYEQLNVQANQLANYFVGLGIRVEDRVVICLPREIFLVVGLLAVLKAGATYVALDPRYPADRLEYLLTNCEPKIVLTFSGSGCERLARKTGYTVLCVDQTQQPWVACSNRNPNAEVGLRPGNLAYVVYTSGSTGKPKGVEVTHLAFCNVLEAIRAELGVSTCRFVPAITSISFDIAALELFLPLISGGVVEVIGDAMRADGRALTLRVAERRFSLIQATPATWQMLLLGGWQGNPDVRLLCGGEALSSELARDLVGRSAHVWNVYGPSETTIWSTIFHIDDEMQRVPIGRPISNTRIYVLDEDMRPVAIGVFGDLYIGGAGLARGYLRRPDLTAERFVADPFGEPGSRLYRTGDRARYRPDGNLEFGGRADRQVKIRGYRIELEEIEAALQALPAIRQARVIVQEQGSVKYLVAYMAADEQRVNVDELRAQLRSWLPEAMVPSTYVFVDALPVTSHGKIDERALPPAQRRSGPGHYHAACTKLEQRLATSWASALDIEHIGATDNFFELGGHSLSAATAVSHICEEYDVELPVLVMFQHPTVESFARYLIASYPDNPHLNPEQTEEL